MPENDFNPEQKIVLVSSSAGQSVESVLGYPQESISLTAIFIFPTPLHSCKLEGMSGSSLQRTQLKQLASLGKYSSILRIYRIITKSFVNDLKNCRTLFCLIKSKLKYRILQI